MPGNTSIDVCVVRMFLNIDVKSFYSFNTSQFIIRLSVKNVCNMLRFADVNVINQQFSWVCFIIHFRPVQSYNIDRL